MRRHIGCPRRGKMKIIVKKNINTGNLPINIITNITA